MTEDETSRPDVSLFDRLFALFCLYSYIFAGVVIVAIISVMDDRASQVTVFTVTVVWVMFAVWWIILGMMFVLLVVVGWGLVKYVRKLCDIILGRRGFDE